MCKFILCFVSINCVFISLASAVDGKAYAKAGSKLSANECQFNHINSYTGIVEKVVVHPCDFIQKKQK